MVSDHAVVVGAGVGGLLSAAALAQTYARVTIVERDELPAAAGHRRGVAQGEQMHSILAIGQDAAEDLVPGIGEAFIQAGAALIDSPRDVASFSSLGWQARGPSEAFIYGLRRVVLEHVLRERVRAVANISFVRGAVTGLLGDGDGRRVTGVRLRDAGRDAIEADLVVDSSGRTSHAPRWVAELGYEPPAEQETVSDITYSTVLVRLPEGALREDVKGILAPPVPQNLHGAVLFPTEHGTHQIAALAQNSRRAPVDREEYIAQLARASTPLVAELARGAEFLTSPRPYKIRGMRRRLWEDMPRRPEGFVVVGDAVMALNPIYGQGMSVAAVQARAMRDVLGTRSLGDGLAGAMQETFRPTLDFVFRSLLQLDAQFPGTTVHGVVPPPPPTSRVFGALATEDWQTAVALRYAGHYFTTDPVRRPEIQAKARAWVAEGRTVRNNDPRVIPPPFEGEPLPL